MTVLPVGPHRRYNPLLDEWVLCSPHRLKRPWDGQQDRPPSEDRPAHDPKCYLCPGNVRANGETNPAYTGTYVFTNDFAALLPEHEASDAAVFESYSDANAQERGKLGELYKVESQRGICRVMCFSPRHDVTVASMDTAAITRVVETWKSEVTTLGALDAISYVQVFENKGAIMGCSNPHPHCQVWASENVPERPRRRWQAQAKYLAAHGSDLLGDYLQNERRDGARIVCENEHFTALVPFWAVWPYEVSIVARRLLGGFPDLRADETEALADVMRRVSVRYDNLFQCSFPYSMGFYGAPTDGQAHPYWRFHAEYYPPLLRSASVKKFLVGYEMTADPQRDLTAEQAAGRLREQSETRFA
ncbi:MAG: hypothetical protein RJA70_1874 [Pseudomonadota bacterium]